MTATVATSQLTQQLQQDLQNELITANQLLRLISLELQQIKYFTGPGGEFEANIKQNASLVTKLANLQHVNIDNLPLITRTQTNTNSNKNLHDEHSSLRNQTSMDDS